MIQTVDNYNLLPIETKTTKKEKDDFLKDRSYYCLSTKTPKEFQCTLKDYQSKSKNNTFFSFFKDQEKRDIKNEDDLIISIQKIDENNYTAQTGNYIGKFVWDGLEIGIKSRFSEPFLRRMLNFANDVYLDDVSVSGSESKDLDVSRFIIYYIFVQSLEKAFLLGLPKSYRSIDHHDMKLKGKIDIDRFIKQDIPFKGKISSTSREQREIQEIIDLLHKAVKIVEQNNFSTKNISHIKTHLKQHKSSSYVSNQTISKAMKSKALQNPIYAPYKKVLEYAKFIIQGSNIEESKNGKKESYGFLVNVAELFEIYVTKLLQKEFSDWSITSPKIGLYEEQFFARKIIPDIVMKKDNQVLVFDTKYKRMNFRDRYQGADVDRNDFFQINTYMSYYQNQEDHQVIAGGLLYPMEGEFDGCNCHSKTWLGNDKTKFIIDGIELNNASKMENIVSSEESFIKRISKIIQGVDK